MSVTDIDFYSAKVLKRRAINAIAKNPLYLIYRHEYKGTEYFIVQMKSGFVGLKRTDTTFFKGTDILDAISMRDQVLSDFFCISSDELLNVENNGFIDPVRKVSEGKTFFGKNVFRRGEYFFVKVGFKRKYYESEKFSTRELAEAGVEDFRNKIINRFSVVLKGELND